MGVKSKTILILFYANYISQFIEYFAKNALLLANYYQSSLVMLICIVVHCVVRLYGFVHRHENGCIDF